MSNVAEKKKHQVSFPQDDKLALMCDEGRTLSRCLTAQNSPILFGCRAGICGTCLSQVLEICDGCIADPSAAERELLDVIAPGNPKARLACQIDLTASISIAPLAEE